MEEKFIVAIEIGSSKLKGALASVHPSGLLNVLAVQEEPLVDSVRYGQIKNVEEVSNRIDRIRRRLEATPAITPRKIESAYVGLNGLSLGSTIAEAQINFENESEITLQTISDLERQAVTSLFTDKEIYDVLPRDFAVDNMAMATPVGTFGHSVKGSFVVISGNPGLLSNINRVFPERLQLNIASTIVAPLAQAEALLTDDERRLGCLFVDFGAETTTVSIYKGGVLQYLVTLPMGSRNITRDLMALGFLEERAEGIKRGLGVSTPGDDTPRIASADNLDQTEINSYISARTGEIIANVMAQIEFAGFKQSDLISGIVMTGGGARMKGFSDMLARQSNMNVRTGIIPRNLRISDTSVSADDAVDVISLLVSIAKGDNITDCLRQPVVERPAIPAADDRYDEDDDEYESRIGRDDDDDILFDDDDDRPRKPSRTAIKEEKRRREEEKRRRDEEKRIAHEARQGSGWVDKFKRRLAGLVSDELNDKLDDE